MAALQQLVNYELGVVFAAKDLPFAVPYERPAPAYRPDDRAFVAEEDLVDARADASD